MFLRKIHHKFVVLFFVLMTFGVGIIGWFSFQVTEKAVISNALQNMRSDLENTINYTDNFHSQAKIAMSMALENPVFKEYFVLPETQIGNQFDAHGVLVLTSEQHHLRKLMNQWTFSIQRRFPIVETCLIDQTGQEHSRITLGEISADKELSSTENETPFFEPSLRLKSGEVHVSLPYMSPDVKEWVFAYTSPIVLDGGSTSAFYHFEIPVSYFQDVLQEKSKLMIKSKADQLNRQFIMTPSGRIIVDSTHSINLKLKPGDDLTGPHDLTHYLSTVNSISTSKEFLAILAKANQEIEGDGVFEESGHDNFVVYKRLPLFDWTLVMVKSYDRLLAGSASLHSIRMVIFGVGLLILLLGGGAVWFIVKRIIRPITQISVAMQQLEKGALHQAIPVVGDDEFYTLARIFNHMSDEIRKQSMELHQEKNKLTTIIYSAREAILVSDEQGQVVLVNPEAERLLDKSTEQIVKEGFLNLIDDPSYLQQFLDRQGVDMPDTLFYKNRVLSFYAATIKNEAGMNIGSAALIRDVTAEKHLEDKLRQMSFTDKLTGLYNRRWMEESLSKEFSRASRYGMELSLLFLDVDHFKKFNDTYGHNIGDRVLELLGNAAKIGFRKTDFACRYGGEEFCILLPNTGKEGAWIAAEHFRKDVESLRVDGLQVTVTIGAVTFPQYRCKTADELLKAADLALYEGKREGRNRVVVYQNVTSDQ